MEYIQKPFYFKEKKDDSDSLLSSISDLYSNGDISFNFDRSIISKEFNALIDDQDDVEGNLQEIERS